MTTGELDACEYRYRIWSYASFLESVSGKKISWVRASAEDLEAVALPDYRARIERMVHIDVAAFDWICPQHIARRYTGQEFAALNNRDLSKP